MDPIMSNVRSKSVILILLCSAFSIITGRLLDQSSGAGTSSYRAVYYGARCLIQHGPHRDVLGEVLLEHPVDEAIAPALGVRQQRTDQLGLAQVVLVDLCPHSLQSELELGLVGVVGAQPLRDLPARLEAGPDRLVLGEQQRAGVVGVHTSRMSQAARHPRVAMNAQALRQNGWQVAQWMAVGS